MTPCKKLPSTFESVAFINACAGEELVRAYNRSKADTHYIEFEIAKTKTINDPMGYALGRIWRVLGQQTHSLRPRAGGPYNAMYVWDFGDLRELQLNETTDGRIVVVLCDWTLV